jgi:hypothetical protein
MKIYICTLKLSLWVEFFIGFFWGEWHWCIDVHQLSLKAYVILEVLVENPFKIVFLTFFSNKCTIKCFSRKKPLLYEKGGDFTSGIHIVLLIFFHFLMFHEPQTWSLIVLLIIYCMYIDFIQSSSFNCWIEINFDSKWTLSSKMLSCKF